MLRRARAARHLLSPLQLKDVMKALMSISTQSSSSSLSLSPRLMWCLRAIRLWSKGAQLLLIHLCCSTSILCLVTLILLCFLSYGFTLMVLCLLALGSYLGYIVSFLAPLGVIPCMLVVQHPWQLLVSLHLKSRQLGDGDQTLLSAIFVAIQHCYRLSCSMVSPFMTPHLLMYHSLLATLSINPLSSNTKSHTCILPSLPNLTPFYSVPSGSSCISLLCTGAWSS